MYSGSADCRVKLHVCFPTAKLLTQGSPNLVFLAGGVPNPEMFPFQSTTISLKDGTEIRLEGKQMAEALQYGPTQG